MEQQHKLQKAFAGLALFLMPFPSLNFGVSFTYADLFLVLAVILNSHELLQLHKFQIPFLLAVPLFFFSGVMDHHASSNTIAQIIYIWGFVVPFGWAAFTNLSIRQIAQILLCAALINAVVAMGQGAGFIPELSFLRQKRIDLIHKMNPGFNRAPGLALSCNSLMLLMTPCFLLLPYLRNARARAIMLLIMLGGIASTVSKSTIMAVPGILYYMWREDQKKKYFSILGIAVVVIGFVFTKSQGMDAILDKLNTTIVLRTETADVSVDTRTDLMKTALDISKDCLLLGHGTAGSHKLIGQGSGSGHTVHVYLLGLVVIAGYPAAVLMFIGITTLIVSLWRHGEVYIAGYLTAHMLACLLTTVLNLSFQSLPFMIAGAALVTTMRNAESRQLAANLAARQLQLRRAA